MEKREPLCTIGRSGTAAVGNSMEVLQKLEDRTSIWFSNPTRYIPKGNEISIVEISAFPCSVADLQVKIGKQLSVCGQING